MESHNTDTGSSRQACQIKDRHVLVALDSSENAGRAALYVADFLGGVPGFRVTLLSIVPEPSEDYFETGEERKAWIEEHRSGAEKMLQNYREVLLQSGFSEDKVTVRVEVRNCPSIADCILDDQKKLGCCTIVLGRRGISKKEEFLYGSTSNKVLHSGKNCAVWVIE
jgi:nucleotide-binding universal stress UspA family protein